jgi:Domain of unknown function (DUF5658)
MDVTAALFTVAVTIGSIASRPVETTPPAPIAAAIASQLAPVRQTTGPAISNRPAPLLPLYASLAVMQGLDIYTTSKAIAAGGAELNPAMQPVASRTWASAAVKAASTAGSIYFIERAWKHNRKGAVILATVINAATAAVVAHNTQVARQR